MQLTQKLKLEELGRIDVETFKKTEKIPLVVVLDNVRSMHNVGAIFRTGDAFLIEKIILCGITPQPPHREIHKAALGATESVDWSYYESVKEAVLDLKVLKYEVLGIEQTSNSMMITDFEIDQSKKYALVLGNEVEGISDEILSICDRFLEIPQLGTKHSLNVSVCGGIVMWEFFPKIVNGTRKFIFFDVFHSFCVGNIGIFFNNLSVSSSIQKEILWRLSNIVKLVFVGTDYHNF